jgi:biopolymer transport protein ExbB
MDEEKITTTRKENRVMSIKNIATMTTTTFCAFSAAIAGAAEKTAGKTADSTSTFETLVKLVNNGGVMMYALILLSFIALCLVFYYLMSLRTQLIAPTSFLNQAKEAIDKKDFELLAEMCSNDPSPAAAVIAAGARIFLKSKNNYRMVRDAVEDEGARQATKLWQRIQVLQDIAVVAPMIGLLGTVVGMIRSFFSLNQDLATPRPTMIASGVSMALTTTAAGLIIGIAAMIFYSIFRAKINKILTTLEEECNALAVEMMVSDIDGDSPF